MVNLKTMSSSKHPFLEAKRKSYMDWGELEFVEGILGKTDDIDIKPFEEAKKDNFMDWGEIEFKENVLGKKTRED
jgi:hypothetical protein